MFNFKRTALRIGLVYGAILLLSYLFFRAQLINLSPYLVVLSILLFLAELHTIFHFSGLLYSLWPRKYKTYNEINYDRNLQLNLYICVCGEPAEIVRETIAAAKDTVQKYMSVVQPYFEPKVIVLNDGFSAGKNNWYEIRELADAYGVEHVMRYDSTGFKAGNINNGLRTFPTRDSHNTIDVIFDADFAAIDDFLLEITKPFVDTAVDFVQTPQRYKNDMTWVAKASGAHQIYFFDYVCQAKAHDNALFLCGTNFAIRRSALDDIGGMDERFITEDYATSLNLHLANKKGVFIQKPLAYGIAPSTLKAYFNQQKRWSKGTFDTTWTYLRSILFGPLTKRQKFHYLLSSTYYLIGVRDLILMIAPIPYLFFGVSVIKENTMAFLTFIYGPFLLYNLILYMLLFKEPVKSLVLDIISFPVFVSSFITSALKRQLGFIVTIKKYEKENIFKVYSMQLLVIALLSTGLMMSLYNGGGNRVAAYINYFWAAFNVFFLSLGFYLMIRDNYGLKLDETFYSRLAVRLSRGYISTKMIMVPVLIMAFVLLMSRTPEFKIFANKDHMDTFVNTVVLQREAVQELLVPANGVYYGYYIPDLNNNPESPAMHVIPGEKPSLTMYYKDWGNEPDFDIYFVSSIAKQNVIPVITWEPWNIEDVKKGDLVQPDYAPEVIASGKYDNYIRRFARDAAAYKKPVFLRFAHEMNGNWYPWGDMDGESAEKYVAMWRHVHDIFEEEGATNMIWVWSPNNTDAYGSSESLLNYYPGDEYVDWVGFSGFNWGTASEYTTWTEFEDIAKSAYTELSKLNKPIMVTETSSVSVGGDKGKWFENAIRQAVPSMKNIKAVVFFNDDYKFADFSLKKGMPTYRVLYNNIARNNYYISDPLLVNRFVQKER